MNLRHIVPALGLVALSASAASAQEIATGLFLNGWSDNILTWAHDTSKTEGGGSLGAENYDSLDFSTAAKLRVDWNVNSQVSARVSMRFYDVGGSAASDNGAYLQESFVNVQANDKTSIMMGKFINPFGWQSAEPTGLNRVNYGLTYQYYGNNDPLGASLSYTAPMSEKGKLASTFQVTNGYFTAQDGTNGGSVNSNDPAVNNHQRNDLGLGADFSFTPHGDKTNVNLEFAYDPSSSVAAAGGQFNGYIFQTGLNGTLMANDKLMIGGEVFYRASQNAIVSNSGLSTEQDIALMATATQTLDTAEKFCPMAATVMYSMDNKDFKCEANTATPVEHQLAVALLTNPYGSSNFGLNLEYQYGWTEGTNSNQNTSQIALEGLVVIP